MYGGVGGCGTMRVHASPSLNKRGAEAAASGQEVTVRPGQSPVKQPLAVASPSPGAGPAGGASTVQDTDDRIPKDSIYGTIRMKRRQESQAAQAVQQGVHQVGKIFESYRKNISITNQKYCQEAEQDVDSLPPPPADDGYDEGRSLAPRPAPRKGGHNQDVLVRLELLLERSASNSISWKCRQPNFSNISKTPKNLEFNIAVTIS